MIRNLLLAAAMAVTGIVTVAAPAPPVVALESSPWVFPVTPPRCTRQQADSGQVANCIIAFYDDPSTTGWGAPPAPGVGAGWTWNTATFSGSAALAGWEQQYIRTNAVQLSGLRIGTLKTHVDVQGLFEGFIRDIDAQGYRVKEAGGYTFRCTSGNGGWSCPSGDPTDLSNHAWGLAVDLNSAANPIRSYTGVDGATACAIPVVTDLPQWVVQTAERWGLYWGGYGWNSGCADTTTQRTSVDRDPPHFEFRGTPAQAAAIASFNLGNDPNRTCFTVIDDLGHEVDRCNLTGRPEAGWRLPVHVDPPAGAVAAMINLTATEPAGPGFLTLEDCGPRTGDRTTSPLSLAAGATVATMAVVPISTDGTFCVYRSTAVHSIVDVVGYLSDTGERLWFDPSTPTRLTDTRVQGACSALTECRPGPIANGGRHVVQTADPAPRIANVAVVDGNTPGFLQAGRCDDVGGQRTFSNLNYSGPGARSNLVVMDGGTAGSCIFALSQAHVVVDELGRLDATQGYGWELTAPTRAFDSRQCTVQWCAGRPAARSMTRIDLALDVPAVAVAVTVTDTSANGYVSIAPCSTWASTDTPDTSNVNYMAGQTVTNLALVELEAGSVCVFTLASANVIIDVQATLVDGGGIGLIPVDPTRAHDSRLPGGS
ncbi:MAG: M15 family metallopeptidase [Ilumatobacteraceae bacterium]